MNKFNNLPDFIDVANIRDLFWNNNSDLYPSCIPTQYHRIEKTRPVFYSPYVGTCVLTGEYNHCVFNGEYYLLSKLEILDIKTGRYKYQLDYDVMINFMNRGADVRGTLIKTNREDILEGCLQTTVPILADPINKVTTGFINIETTRWGDLEFKFPDFNELEKNKKFNVVLPTKSEYQKFINRVNNNPIGQGTKNKKWLCTEKLNEYNAYALQNPLIILDRLPLNSTYNSWKLSLLKNILKFFKSLPDIEITTQSSVEDHFNNGKPVLGIKNKGIGSNILSDLKLQLFDISDLADIVPIDNRTKEKLQPTRKLTYDLLPETPTTSEPIKDFVPICLVQRPYLPIANNKGSEGTIKSPGDGVNGYDIDRNWYGELPQKIYTKNKEVGYLWHLNKNNLVLLDGGRAPLTDLGLGYKTSIKDDIYSRWGLFSTEYKNIAPLGFLIWQVRRPTAEWDDYEYIGHGAKEIIIRTGLSKEKCLNKYGKQNTSEWWGNIDPEMELWGSSLVSRINLDLDQFNWLSIAPSYKGYEYKYYWGNYWGYQKFFPHAGNRELWYPSRINRMNIKWNNKELENPYAYDDPDTRLPKWLEARTDKLDDISLYTKHTLKTFELKKGDIFVTDIEHKWIRPDGLLKHFLPYWITDSEWSLWLSKHFKEIPGHYEGLSPYRNVWTTGLAYAEALYGMDGLSDILNIYPHTKSAKTSIFDIPNSTVVLYLHKGKYRLGIFKRIFVRTELSKSNDNLIETVNGETTAPFYSYLIRPIGEEEVDYKNDSPVTELLKLDIVAHAAGLHQEKIDDLVYFYSEDDFKIGTYTFDLVGTKWYLIIHNGAYNLAPKDNSVFSKIKDEGGRVFFGSGEYSTYAKINQKAELNYYGQIFPLNTKFSKGTTIKFTSQTLPTKDFSDPDVEYKWLQIKEPHDYIDALVTIPRKEVRAAEKVDSSQLLLMKEKLLQLNTNYEQDRYANQLMISTKQLQMARQREDLYWNKVSAGVNIATKGVGAALGLAAAGAGGAATLPMAVGAYGAATSMGSDITFLLKYPTLMERVNQDERDLLLANSQMLYQRKQNYEHDFRIQTLKLNKIAGTWQKPGVSNRDAFELYNKERFQIDGIVTTLEILWPSPEQQKQIDHIYSTFGCECVSDWFEESPLAIRDNMEPGLYRFSKIQKGGLISAITDTTLRDILKQILENGVKFESCEFEVDPIESPVTVALAKSPKVVFDPHNTKDWPKEKWDLYLIETNNEEVLNTIKKLPHYGLTDDEWNKHKDNLKDIDDQTLLDRINQIISGRESGKPVIIQLPKVPEGGDTTKLTETINALQDQITECETREANLRKLINDLNSQLSNRQTTIDQLTSDKTNLQTQLTECRDKVRRLNQKVATQQGNVTTIQGTVTALTLEKEELLKKHKECESRITRLLQAQATCDRVNTQKIKELEAQIKECKAEKDQIQSEIARVTAELTTKNKELETANRELERVKNELNTSKAEIETIKAQVAEKDTQLSTCQADSTKKEQDLRKQIQDLNAQITRNTNQISSLQTKVTNLTNKRNELAEQNKKLKEDLAGARSKANADRQLQDQVANLNKQLEAKDTELEQAHNDCERIKNELRDKQVALETEIHQHKVDKEDLTQQLNNERVRAINEKDEINKLKKQLEDSKGDKDKITELEEELENLKLEAATCDERIAAKHRELEQCRLELDIARKQPKEPSRPVIPDECDLIKSVLNEPYSYELKTRENGFDAFLDLVFDLAQNLTWEGRSRIDQKLFKIPEVVPLLERLEELKNVPIIDKAIDLTKEPGYDVFRQWMEQGGDLNGRIPGIISKYNDIKLMETPTNIHAVKAILDELNWQSFKTKGLLAEQLKTNEDLQFLFTHIYPGSKTLDLYKEIYGDPNIAIIRKRFTEETECTPDGEGSALLTLDNYRRNTKHSVEDITRPTKSAPETTPTTPQKPKETQIRIKRDLVFKPTDDQSYRQVRNLIPNFNEAVKGHWTSERQYDYTWIIWNYVYWRYAKSEWGGTGSAKIPLAWIRQRVGEQLQSGRYILITGVKDDRASSIPDNVSRMWNNRNNISAANVISDIRNGTKKLTVRLANVPTFEYEVRDFDYELSTNCINDLESLGLLEDFVKMVIILSSCRLDWSTRSRDYTDNYKILHPIVFNYETWSRLNDRGDDYLAVVGWLFPAEHVQVNGTWYDVHGKSYTNIGSNMDTALYQFIRWFYEVASNSRQFVHPWKFGAQGAYAFIKAIDDISI